MHHLRPHQARTRAAVVAAYREGKRRQLVCMPTGAGKTITGASVIVGAIRKGRRALWLTHRRELNDQASNSLAAAGVDHGVVLAGRPSHPERAMQVASVQTLTAAGRAPEADIIVIDEAHHTAAETWRTIVAAYPAAELVLGLTATPERGDGSPLSDIFDSMIVGATVAELTAAGLLVPCDVIAPPKYLERGLGRDPIAAWSDHARGRPTVVFAATVAHAKELAEGLTRAGARAACVEGTMSAEARADALAAFAEGRIDVLTNVQVLTEGWDCPCAAVCILARGCSSAATYLQMVGRILRPSPGKARALLLDLRGVVHVHGLPDEERTFSLHGRGIARPEAREPVQQCRACGAMFPPVRQATPCPVCGVVAAVRPPPRVTRAPLAAVTPDMITPGHVKRAVFDELVRECRERGWKPQAVGVRFKQKFGVWPPFRLPRAVKKGAANA